MVSEQAQEARLAAAAVAREAEGWPRPAEMLVEAVPPGEQLAELPLR